MLVSLEIRNVALIESLHLDLHPGMQILAGETGAGKSIVVDAVNLALGGRADKNLIRFGTDRASVEAVFDVPNQPDIRRILEENDVEYDGRTVTVWREISTSGRNICRICGILLPVGVLKEISAYLMDIHGQHEHQFLMNPDMHRSFLDRIGDESHQQLLQKTALDCEVFLKVHRFYARLRKEENNKQQRMEELESRLKELHEARLRSGEEESLQQEIAILRDTEKNAVAMATARDHLCYGNSESSALEKIHEACSVLSQIRNMDEDMKALAQRFESLYYELEEISYELQKQIERCDADPERLEAAEARLDRIRKLERKYGPDIPAVLAEQQRLESEYETFCGLDDQIGTIAREHKRLLGVYRMDAQQLSESRKRIASLFEENMMIATRRTRRKN